MNLEIIEGCIKKVWTKFYLRKFEL